LDKSTILLFGPLLEADFIVLTLTSSLIPGMLNCCVLKTIKLLLSVLFCAMYSVTVLPANIWESSPNFTGSSISGTSSVLYLSYLVDISMSFF